MIVRRPTKSRYVPIMPAMLRFDCPVSAGPLAVKPQQFVVDFSEKELGLRVAQAPFWIVVRMPLRDGSVIYPMILTVNNVPVTKLNVFLKMLRVLPRPLRIGFVLPPGAPLLREWIEPNALDILAGVACGMNNLQTIVNAEYQPILPRM